MSNLDLLQQHYPFLTLYQFGETEHIGLIQNQSKNIVTVYVYDTIETIDLKKTFLDLCNRWWNESNRKIPINLFLKQDFVKFSKYLENYPTKEFKMSTGYSVSLQNLNEKRIKRKRIELIRNDLDK